MGNEQNITNCKNPDCQRIATQLMEWMKEKIEPPTGIEWIFRIPMTRIIIQKVEKYNPKP